LVAIEMDKEDMLIAFEDHIRGLEREEDDGKQKDRERERRKFRKNRDAFLVLLDELHSSGKLTSVSLWKERYALISSDHRYHSMLGQPGSTPLDLFKFYVEDLKARLYDEKKIIKEILKDTGYEVEVETTFDQFTAHIASDPRSDSLDRGNMKLTFASMVEKAEAREKERIRAEERKQRKREASFKAMLKAVNPPLLSSDPWEEVNNS
jgi:pre-mRNA-processing factor 40